MKRLILALILITSIIAISCTQSDNEITPTYRVTYQSISEATHYVYCYGFDKTNGTLYLSPYYIITITGKFMKVNDTLIISAGRWVVESNHISRELIKEE